MLSKKTLILTLAAAFSVHSSNGQSQEKPFIEVSFTMGFYIRKVKALPELDSMVKAICLGDDILLKSDTRYCFSPDPAVRTEASSRAASDDGSDNEDSSTSDENNDNRSDENENEADAEPDVQYVTTTLNPFPISIEINQHCRTMELKKIKQESISDSEMPTESEVNLTKADSVNHPEITLPAYSTNHMGHLKTHKQARLPANQRPRVQCDHEGCNYSTDRTGNLKTHKLTHLPVDQRPGKPKKPKKLKRPKVHQCDHEGCHYRTDLAGNLKTHKRIHLPADQRLRVHQCDHEGCNYRTDHTGNLKTHKLTHLPIDQRPWKPKRPKVHLCDHEGCNYCTGYPWNLKIHKERHLPADQRQMMYQCDHNGCNFHTNHMGNLKTHKRNHLPADQRVRKIKRKADDQPPADKKRTKVD